MASMQVACRYHEHDLRTSCSSSPTCPLATWKVLHHPLLPGGDHQLGQVAPGWVRHGKWAISRDGGEYRSSRGQPPLFTGWPGGYASPGFALAAMVVSISSRPLRGTSYWVRSSIFVRWSMMSSTLGACVPGASHPWVSPTKMRA